jgi:hypothetical protein
VASLLEGHSGYGELSWKRDSGDDLIKGGSYGSGDLYVVGGYGDDTIFSGADRTGNIYIWGDNRAIANGEGDAYASPDDLWKYGREGDGDDVIDVEENDGNSIYIYGQGGNDKIIGSIQGAGAAIEKLYGGDGDDKIWLLNPGQVELADSDDKNEAFGGRGNDIIYGTNRRENMYGNDGNDIIYSGVND